MRALLWVVGLGFGFTCTALGDPAAAVQPAADRAWSQIGGDAKHLTDAEQARNLEAMKPALVQVRADVAAFLEKFPRDRRIPGARLMQAQADQLALGLDLPDAPNRAAVLAEFRAIATDSSVPAELRVQASMVDAQEIFMSVMAGLKDNPHDPAIWNDLESKIEAFEKTTGPGPGQEPEQAAVMLRHNQVMLLEQAGETDRLQALLAQLEKSSQPEMAAMAQEAATSLKQAADLKTKPLDLQFTALDGSPVDLAKLRGKVVLLDFWATWCPPCRGETPDVVAAYQKYHAQGLEIVGISLDQDKAALQKYIDDNHMPWPQYFDGKGWDNVIGQRFGIESIPAMWLIGRDGIVATQDARDDLDGQVGKLLGGP